MEIDVGHVVADKYELVRLLGRGSMGEVWVAHHRTLEEELAVKLLTRSPSSEEELEDPATAAARFLFEAQVAARLSRKTRHIVRVTDHGEDQGVAYLVMELLEGETLESALVRDRRVQPSMVAAIVTQVARALAQAHSEGVLHRDLKPANVFLTKDEDGQLLVKLLDFGIARTLRTHRVRSAFSTAKGLVFGTPCYMSPEQARASVTLDHRCDLWALATIAYEALTGELPIEGKDTDELLHRLCAGRILRLRDRAPDLPAALDAVFARAFAEPIGARFASATELARAIEDAVPREARPAPPEPIADEPVPSTPDETWTMQAERRRKRARAGVFLVGASVLGLVAAGVAWRSFARGPARASTLPSAPGSSVVAIPPSAPGSSGPQRIPEQPAVAVSSLPRVLAHSPPAAPRTITGAAASAEPTAPSAGAPPASPPILPEPIPFQPPAPAPTPKKIDKSEVL
jgi:eukaryotic-like serine/threonine-protein kinase